MRSTLIRVTNLEFLTTCEARFGFSVLEFPQKSSLAAERGTYLHNVFHEIITNSNLSITSLPPRSPYNDDLHLFYTNIRNWWRKYNKTVVVAEERFQAPIEDDNFLISGKPDVVVRLENDDLKIIDLKTGKDVEHYLYSSQLPLYSLLVTYALKLPTLLTRVSILNINGVEYERNLRDEDFEYAYSLVKLGMNLLKRGIFHKSFGCSYCDFYEYCITINKNYVTFEELQQLKTTITTKTGV